MIIITIKKSFLDKHFKSENNEEVTVNENVIFDDSVDEKYESLKSELVRTKELYQNLRALRNSLEKDIRETRVNHQLLLEKHSVVVEENNALYRRNKELTDNENILKSEIDSLNERENELSDEVSKSHDKIASLLVEKQKYSKLIEELVLGHGDLSHLGIGIKYTPFYQIIEKSGLFDRTWYASRYLNDDDCDALAHYLTVGYKKNYNPNSSFNSEFYVSEYPSVQLDDVNPLIDYILSGYSRRTSSPESLIRDSQEYVLIKESNIIDNSWYNSNYNLDEDTDSVEHYLMSGNSLDYNPNSLFDNKYYKEVYGVVNPVLDYIFNPSRITKEFNPYEDMSYFDITSTYQYQLIKDLGVLNEKWYKHEYKIDEDAIEHYLMIGKIKNFKPNLLFDITKYDDREKLSTDKLTNYLLYYAMDETKNIELPKLPGVNINESIEYTLISESGLFDEDYYLKCSQTSSADLIADYLENNANNINPNNVFDNNEYLEKHPEVSGRNPLVEYILNVDEVFISDTSIEERYDIKDSIEYTLISESGLIDEDYYLKNNSDVVDVIEDFLTHDNRNPSKEFNIEYYTSKNPEISKENMNPLLYYILFDGNNKDTAPQENVEYDKEYYDDYAMLKDSKLFDEEFYARKNPNVKNSDAIEYFITKGYNENYPTSKYFDYAWYKKHNPDIVNARLNPLIHYIRQGHLENRPIRRAKLNLDESGLSSNIKDCYNTLFESTWFDEKYYMDNNPSVKESDIDSILHYVLYGADNGDNPNELFSTKRYLEMNPDVKNASLNPLYHYINVSKTENKLAYSTIDNVDSKYSLNQCKNIINALNKKISIIIPIYNAFDETKSCIKSVLENTHINYELILINDCSGDKRIDELLKQLENIDNIKIVNNKTNQGFIKNVNNGIKMCDGDVVLLNSDTIVTPYWLSHILITAYSDNAIATITPFCNSSDISIDELGKINDPLFLNKNAYQVNKLSNNNLIEAPTGNGFCLFVKRDVINDIGYFDETFGKGYGEESDFTTRALKNGWKNIRDDSVFVYHRRHASFTKESTDKIKEKNMRLLKERYPELSDNWDDFTRSPILTNSIKNIKDNLVDYKNSERILYVTEYYEENRLPVLDENIRKLSRNYDCYILATNPENIYLYQYKDNKVSVINKFFLSDKWDLEQFIKYYMNIFLNLKIDLLYIRNNRYFNDSKYNKLTSFIRLTNYLELPVVYDSSLYGQDVLKVVESKLNSIHDFNKVIDSKRNYLNFNNKKTVVYTTRFGNDTTLKTPEYINDNLDYICFTDNPRLKSEFWNVKLVDDSTLEKNIKILSHEYLNDYDYSIYIDSNVVITGDIEKYIYEYSVNNKFLALKTSKNSLDIISNEEFKHYQNLGCNPNDIISSSVLFRNHNDEKIIKLMNFWYYEVKKHDYSDVLALNYTLWKNNYKIDESNELLFKNKYFYQESTSMLELKYSDIDSDRILKAFDETTTIIIRSDNDLKELRACIDSIKRYTTINYSILIIDDANNDTQLRDYLNTLNKEDNIRVIHNTQKEGFTKCINRGFEESSDDVVVLSSNMVVTPKWLQKLKIDAYNRHRVATVTAVSNNLDEFSVLDFDEIKGIKTIKRVTNILDKEFTDSKITTQYGASHCIYIKRIILYSIAFLDEKYSIESIKEFTQRLTFKWYNVVDPSIFVYNNKSITEKESDGELIRKEETLMLNDYPQYLEEKENIKNNVDFRNTRNKINSIIDSNILPTYDKKNILYVVHDGIGGTLHTSIELMKNIDESMNTYLLTSDGNNLKLYEYDSNKKTGNSNSVSSNEFIKYLKIIGSWTVKDDYTLKNPYNNEFRNIYFNILTMLRIDMVHIRHLIRHTFDLPKVSHKLGIPVILSFHDMYYICVSHNLIDDKLNYCGGHCTPIHGISTDKNQCAVNTELGIPLAKAFVQKWRKYVREMFKYCSEFITTSKSTRDLYYEFYPELKDKEFHIIGHGRDLTTPNNIHDTITQFDNTNPIKIVFPGHLSKSKGSELIKEIKMLDKTDKLEYHFMGELDGNSNLEEYGINHGIYNRNDFNDIICEIKPHFIGILSIWPETYCHTLTEAWSSGIPVLAIDIGAVGERIHNNGGGFFIDNNPQKAYNQILDIVNDEKRYLEVAKEIQSIRFKSTKEMANEYYDIYKKFF